MRWRSASTRTSGAYKCLGVLFNVLYADTVLFLYHTIAMTYISHITPSFVFNAGGSRSKVGGGSGCRRTGRSGPPLMESPHNRQARKKAPLSPLCTPWFALSFLSFTIVYPLLNRIYFPNQNSRLNGQSCDHGTARGLQLEGKVGAGRVDVQP